VLPFLPSFELVGIESNWDLSLPIEQSPTETPTPSQNISNNKSKSNLTLIVGLLAGALVLVLLFIAVGILFKRREQGKETYIELQLLPKYSSPNKQIRLMKEINSGGFGVVWKARYKGKTVAIKVDSHR
jgi:hypothetical protein